MRILKVTFIWSTNASLPKISYVKGIDVYLVFCFVMTFCSVIEYGVISFLHRRIERIKKKKPESSTDNQKSKEREHLKTVYIVPKNNRYCSEQKIW